MIANWDLAGVRFEGGRQNSIEGCYIGTHRFGTTAAGNQDGVVIAGGGPGHHVGTETGGNVISSNRRYGVHLSGTHDCHVSGNLIGTDRTGTLALGNGSHAVYLSDGTEYVTVGGDDAGEGNLISANGGNGVQIEGPGIGGNFVYGNLIGTDAAVTGTLGNGGDGVYINDSHRNTIGGAGDRANVISGNPGSGVHLVGANRTTVASNFIGTDPGEILHLGNGRHGVEMDSGSEMNTIGPGNVIAHNGEHGVLVFDWYTIRNTITQNSITDNGGLGISNEDEGNEELMPPIISRATTTYVEGAACPLCQVEVFSDPAGEGEVYEGAALANSYGAWTWYGSLSWGPANVTATATDSDGNTSEFSWCHDEYEPNDDLDYAFAIGIGDDIEGTFCHHDDRDYYRFPVPAGSLITIELELSSRAHVSLYDPHRAVLDGWYVRLDRWVVTHPGVEGGDYFVGVHAADPVVPPAPYTLRVTVAPIEDIDFEGYALEVTQAVQDLNNSVVLVANKRTYARFHVRSLAYGDLGPVTASLTAWQPGFFLGTILPNNPGGTITVLEEPDRGELEHSFYFDLPSSWLDGSVRLTAEVNHAHTVPETDYTNNAQTVDVTFQETPEMYLRIVDVCYITDTITYHVHDEDRLALESWLRRAYPIDRLHVEWSTKSPCFDHWPSGDEVNTDLITARSLNLYSDDSAHPYMRYYGMIDDGYFRTIGYCGGGKASGIPSLEACGRAGDPGGWCYGWDTDDSYADHLGGHELGHTYGRRHTRGTQPPGCPAGESCCGREPGHEIHHPDGDISPTRDGSDPDALYGFDIETLVIYPPDWKDVMTYCDYNWMSDHTYKGIHDQMVITETVVAAARRRVAAPQEYLAVFGTVYSDTHEVELGTFYRLPDAWDVLGRVPGDYSIRLLDGAGSTLADYPFTPKFCHVDSNSAYQTSTQQEEEVTGVMAVFVPWVTGTARIAIYHDSQELASRPVSAHAPQVTLTYPNGGEVLDGDQILATWEASDADGDALAYTLEYSVDGGARWQVLSTGVNTTTLLLDAAIVPGTDEGKFRVRASDGVNTAQDESDGTFTVPNKAPRVWIVSPEEGASYLQGQSVALVASSIDVEDGSLDDAALSWTSSLSGALGMGRMLHVTDLIPGTHVITLTATDSGGATNTEEVTILVEGTLNKIYLPLILKSYP